MKTLKLSNGEIRKGYELSDLSEDVKNKVIAEHINFLDSLSEPFEDEDGNMSDEWVSHTEEDAIESAEINGYLFDEDGNMLPTLYHYEGNKHVKTTFGKNQYLVEFI